ncbi:MAG TPA: 30S ribosomal protein S3ae, partial [Methanomassiliicoccales archaeon]|nr:30S ribosomal protein S3ae [Methanomassiliicoccales archaeon]
AVRTLMTNSLQKAASEMTISELVKAIISGDMARDLSNVSKVIVPIKRVEIRKTEVLEMGNKAAQDQSIMEAPPEEEKPAEGEAAPVEATAEAPAEAQPEETEEIKSEDVSEEEELGKEKESGEQ